jgi:hypothetical protein
LLKLGNGSDASIIIGGTGGRFEGKFEDGKVDDDELVVVGIGLGLKPG